MECPDYLQHAAFEAIVDCADRDQFVG
jgi:hypothetical protein